MPSTGIGVYKGSDYIAPNEEVSSTYEGRHLTFLASDIKSHMAGHALQQAKHQCVIGEHIVGVAFTTEVNGSDLIAIDTEGIWNLDVSAIDDEGDRAVVAGDELYINKTTGLISKIRDRNVNTLFGYALGNIGAAGVYEIAVKIHWGQNDDEEVVGTRAVPKVSGESTYEFRKYCYEGQGGSEQVGDWLELEITTASCFWAAAMFRRISWTADQNWITGYSAVAELELAIATGAGTMDTCTILQMNSMIGVLTATGHNNFRLSWIRMQDYGLDNEEINNFFELINVDTDYPVANNPNVLFCDSGDIATSQTLKILVNGVTHYILCASTN